MRLAYADPPYPGCAHLYKSHPDFAGEVDHRELVERLQRDYDGWVLHTSVGGYRMLERERILPEEGIRVCQWFKPFAAFKRNVPVAYAYEPVIIKAARKPVVVKGGEISRDWIDEAVREGITMKRGLTGAKPDRVCRWAFQLMGALPDDDLTDLYPGTGAVSASWRAWLESLQKEPPMQQLVGLTA
jgi:hypothetical protein